MNEPAYTFEVLGEGEIYSHNNSGSQVVIETWVKGMANMGDCRSGMWFDAFMLVAEISPTIWGVKHRGLNMKIIRWILCRLQIHLRWDCLLHWTKNNLQVLPQVWG